MGKSVKNRCVGLFLTIFFCAFTTSAYSIEPIKILLARGSTSISKNQVRTIIIQANVALDNTFSSGAYEFESAAFTASGTPKVIDVTCISGTGVTLNLCARNQLSTKRTNNDADIVVLAVEEITDENSNCALVPPQMINATIGPHNHELAYVLVQASCLPVLESGILAVPHEIGHLLSLEHHDSDVDPLPRPDNHAAEAGSNLTLMGSIGDCYPSCDDVVFHQFLSSDGAQFPDGSAAGDADDSNSKLVVSDESWAAVASYRPLPAVSTFSSCGLSFVGCYLNRPSFAVTARSSNAPIINMIWETSSTGSNWDQFYPATECNIFIGLHTFEYQGTSGYLQYLRGHIIDAYGQPSAYCQLIAFATCGGGQPFAPSPIQPPGEIID